MPSSRVTVVLSLVIGLSVRTLVTSTLPVIRSPGLTGALKFQSTWRNTVPGPGNLVRRRPDFATNTYLIFLHKAKTAKSVTKTDTMTAMMVSTLSKTSTQRRFIS